ncbi:hypothetical protein AX16_000905 [Volvariella volvacea WC 439]|nr:hypothetical protein AX16_000905 [Volvariella volvacea WC 439]
MSSLLSIICQAFLSFWSCVVQVVTHSFRPHPTNQARSRESSQPQFVQREYASASTCPVLPPIPIVSISAPLPSPVASSVVFPNTPPQNSNISELGSSDLQDHIPLTPNPPEAAHARHSRSPPQHFCDFLYYEEISPTATSTPKLLPSVSRSQSYTGSIHRNYRHRNRRKVHDLGLPPPVPLPHLPTAAAASSSVPTSVAAPPPGHTIDHGSKPSTLAAEHPSTIASTSSPSLYPPTPSFKFSPQACSSPPFQPAGHSSLPLVPDQHVPVLGCVMLYDAPAIASQEPNALSNPERAMAESSCPNPIMIDEVLEGHEVTVQVPIPIPSELAATIPMSPAPTSASLSTVTESEGRTAPDLMLDKSTADEGAPGIPSANSTMEEKETEDGYWDEFGQWQCGFYLSPMEVYNPRCHYAKRSKILDSDDECDWFEGGDAGSSSGLSGVDARRNGNPEYKEVRVADLSSDDDDDEDRGEDGYSRDSECGSDAESADGSRRRSGSRAGRRELSPDSFFASVRYGVVFDRERFGLRGNGDEGGSRRRKRVDLSTIMSKLDFDNDDDDEEDDEGSVSLSDVDGVIFDSDEVEGNASDAVGNKEIIEKPDEGKAKETQTQEDCTRSSIVSTQSDAGSDESIYPPSNEAVYNESISSDKGSSFYWSRSEDDFPAKIGNSEADRNHHDTQLLHGNAGNAGNNSIPLDNQLLAPHKSPAFKSTDNITACSSPLSRSQDNNTDTSTNAPNDDTPSSSAYSQLQSQSPHTPVKQIGNASRSNDINVTSTPTLKRKFLNESLQTPTPRANLNLKSHFIYNSYPTFNYRGYRLREGSIDFEELLSRIRPSKSETRITFNSVKAESKVSIVQMEGAHAKAEMAAVIVSNGFEDGKIVSSIEGVGIATPGRVGYEALNSQAEPGNRTFAPFLASPKPSPASSSPLSPIYPSHLSSMTQENLVLPTPVLVNGMEKGEANAQLSRDQGLDLRTRKIASRRLGGIIVEQDEELDAGIMKLWSVSDTGLLIHGLEEPVRSVNGADNSYGEDEEDLFSVGSKIMRSDVQDRASWASTYADSSSDAEGTSSPTSSPVTPLHECANASPSPPKTEDEYHPLRSAWSESSTEASPNIKSPSSFGASFSNSGKALNWFRRGGRSASAFQLTGKQTSEERKSYHWHKALPTHFKNKQSSMPSFNLVDKLFLSPPAEKSGSSSGTNILNTLVFKKLRLTEEVRVEGSAGESANWSNSGDHCALKLMDEVLDISHENNHAVEDIQDNTNLNHSSLIHSSASCSSVDSFEGTSLSPVIPVQQGNSHRLSPVRPLRIVKRQRSPLDLDRRSAPKSESVQEAYNKLDSAELEADNFDEDDLETSLVSPLDALAADIRRQSASLEHFEDLHQSLAQHPWPAREDILNGFQGVKRVGVGASDSFSPPGLMQPNSITRNSAVDEPCSPLYGLAYDESDPELLVHPHHEGGDSHPNASRLTSILVSSHYGASFGDLRIVSTAPTSTIQISRIDPSSELTSAIPVTDTTTLKRASILVEREQRRSRAVDDILALLDSPNDMCAITSSTRNSNRRSTNVAEAKDNRSSSRASGGSWSVAGTTESIDELVVDEDVPLSQLKARGCYAI